MRPEQVRFSSCPSSFLVEMTQCANPECECTEVGFHFQELVERDRPTTERKLFQIRVDGETWTEVDPPPRPPEIDRWVEEFLRDYPPCEQKDIQETCREKQRIARRFREYCIDPSLIADGRLIAFDEIIHDRTYGRAAIAQFFCAFEHEGIKYVVDDLYCPTPECDCNEVHLAFVRCAPSSQPDGVARGERYCLVRLPFEGQTEIVECEYGTIAEAEAVLASWRERHEDAMEEIQWRYDMVKKIARRSCPRQADVSCRGGAMPEKPSPIGMHVGRNDLCPCGSGKKYKRCCGGRR